MPEHRKMTTVQAAHKGQRKKERPVRAWIMTVCRDGVRWGGGRREEKTDSRSPCREREDGLMRDRLGRVRREVSLAKMGHKQGGRGIVGARKKKRGKRREILVDKKKLKVKEIDHEN